MRSIWFLILLGSLITYHCLTTVAGEETQPSADASQPTLEQCKGYVDAALKTSSPAAEDDDASTEDSGEPPDGTASEEQGDEDASTEQDGDSKEDVDEEEEASEEEGEDSQAASTEEDDVESTEGGDDGSNEEDTTEDQSTEDDASAAPEDGTSNENEESEEATEEQATAEEEGDSAEADATSTENTDTGEDKTEEDNTAEDNTEEDTGDSAEVAATGEDEDGDASQEGDSGEATAEDADSAAADEDSGEENSAETDGGEQASAEDEEDDGTATAEDTGEDDDAKSEEDDKPTDGDTEEDSGEAEEPDGAVSSDVAEQADESDESSESEEGEATQEDQATAEDTGSPEAEAGVSAEDGEASQEEASDTNASAQAEEESGEQQASAEEDATSGSEEETDSEEEEEQEQVEPYEPRSRDHITQILGLDDSEETQTTSTLLDKVTTATLKELKSTYENAIKPLEQLYKYRDLSNRHFGDPEIFSKPLIVFMGPWSGGKSTIINWLLGIQHEDNALRTGADPSPAQFNIMMYGNEPEKLDGTQLAADWTFSGLQKFGQSFLDRLRGQKLPNRLLEKVNIVEIPGILEVRKQVERSFPFNDACQWFIDRADTLFLIYDPAKLDIGPETEAILDQLKGRENQVRIVLNKADTVKPDELLRVQAMLVWNISPLMSSAEPPIMYAASLWDRPLQVESPKSLLVAHENNFLKDIRDGIERRVETRIAAARRFAVRVRNHAKMVDCYLNTYNNHRSFFSDKKKVSTDIIDHPQNYHIYEGLSTLNNISRYDLPDPDTYRDFFRLNPIWEFPTLQSTCSFWRGCPLHKLDIAIAYELPEILGKFRRQREAINSAKKQGSSRN